MLDGLKPVIEKPIEAPSLDIPGDYRKLVDLLGTVDLERLEGEVSKTGRIEGNDPEDQTVAGTNQITVSTNDGAVNGGGGDTVCTVPVRFRDSAGCGKPGR